MQLFGFSTLVFLIVVVVIVSSNSVSAERSLSEPIVKESNAIISNFAMGRKVKRVSLGVGSDEEDAAPERAQGKGKGGKGAKGGKGGKGKNAGQER